MHAFDGPFANHPVLNQVSVPDLWQQEAVNALRQGRDVVVQAPTGSGKTLIFELWSNQGKPKGQAIYTVPTRALANDKLAEWRARGWNVGIATGDVAENLSAPVLVATLETQKHRLIRGEGPQLLVIDEYQMLADADRGLNYELAIGLAPSNTQLLLLSGSVANPHDLVKWLTRLGRSATLIKHDIRPVPLEEVHSNSLSHPLPATIHGYWPRLVARALAENLGPILIFAPRRQTAEELAFELARYLPTPNPLALTSDQKTLAGDSLGKLLKNRIAYHHSGLSYGARAGVIEPLAKAGQLRVVVATMGLAAGINFSLRSVALAGESYRRDQAEQPLRPDELLQMFGRAGRRGIDEIGYVIVTRNDIRLHEAHTAHLSRSGMVDWGALLSLMRSAAAQGIEPFSAAVRAQERLFTTKPIWLGVEESLKNPVTACGLRTDAERARHVRRRVREFRNSRGEWERLTQAKDVPAGSAITPRRNLHTNSTAATPTSTSGNTQQPTHEGWIPALAIQAAVEKLGFGTLASVGTENGVRILGRHLNLAELLPTGKLLMSKWIRKLIQWNGRQTSREVWTQDAIPLIQARLQEKKLTLLHTQDNGTQIIGHIGLGLHNLRCVVDSHGQAIWHPEEREVKPEDCGSCPIAPQCRTLSPSAGVALLWRRLKLVDAQGKPTRRGEIVSFFSQSDGLAIAAALEDDAYPLDELVYDLANLDAGFRFAGDDNRWGGRLAVACRQAYGIQTFPGYLENGLPPRYGCGAEQIVAAVHKDPLSKSAWISPFLGAGDIDRAIIEWRSLMRQITHCPTLDWDRWTGLQTLARGILEETSSPTLKELPALDYHQTKRIDHRLTLRRI